MQVVSAETMRNLDAAAIAAGTSGMVLMERAGYGAFRFMAEVACPAARRILVVAGKGNNGGDACVVARYLAESGRRVVLMLTCSPEALDGDAKTNHGRLAGMGITEIVAPDAAQVRAAWQMLHVDVIVDGVLGTGVQGAVSGAAAAAIACMNEAIEPVLSLDVPSGMDCSTGAACGTAVNATWTVTFGHAKRAMLTDEGGVLCGRVEVVDIGLPRAPEGVGGDAVCLAASEVAALLPRRRIKDHKNRFGHVLVIAGSRGMTGAPVLCAQAALASGAGLVTLAVPDSLVSLVAAEMPACMTLPVPDGGLGAFTHDAVHTVFEHLAQFNSVALGPGLSRHKVVDGFLKALLIELYCPTVVDADAINHMADKPELLASVIAEQVIMTPHPGEFERLSGTKTDGNTAARIAAAQKFADEHEFVVLLKGHQTVIAAPGTMPHVNLTGNPGMATAGSGDVLTGVLSALLAQGMSPLDAARAGAFLHGLAGDIAAGIHGHAALTAPRIIDALGAAFKYIMPRA